MSKNDKPKVKRHRLKSAHPMQRKKTTNVTDKLIDLTEGSKNESECFSIDDISDITDIKRLNEHSNNDQQNFGLAFKKQSSASYCNNNWPTDRNRENESPPMEL